VYVRERPDDGSEYLRRNMFSHVYYAVKIITYLSLSDRVPLQSTISFKHLCYGITYYSNPTTVVLLARSLPTSPHPCKYRSAQTDDCAPKRRFDFVLVGRKSRPTSQEVVVAALTIQASFKLLVYIATRPVSAEIVRVRSRLTTYPV
jgi:hypothetical protein